MLAALADDLNTPEAFVILGRLATAARRQATNEHKRAAKQALLGAGTFLGLLQQDPEQWFKGGASLRATLSGPSVVMYDESFEQAVDALIEQRRIARDSKDFARADQIRKKLAEMNIEVEDTPNGPRWKVAATP
jgi:cysteinyl-tRNA synthetase